MFVGGLPHNLELSQFRQYFVQFGPIDDIVILLDKRTHRPRGFGFVTFSNIMAVNHVLRLRAHHQIEGKWVDVKSAVPVAQMREVLEQLQIRSRRVMRVAAAVAREQQSLKSPAASHSNSSLDDAHSADALPCPSTSATTPATSTAEGQSAGQLHEADRLKQKMERAQPRHQTTPPKDGSEVTYETSPDEYGG